MSWLIAAILFALRITLLGACLVPEAPDADVSPRAKWLRRWGLVLCSGLAANLVLMLLAAQCGVWTVCVDWGSWAATLLVGFVLRRRRREKPFLVSTLLWWAATASLVGIAMLMPLRSEWLAGGSDPGLYQNESLAIARLDGLQPETETIYARMTPERRELFVRSSPGYDEVLPSIPIDMETGALGRYFFPMTPLLGALMSRLGGVEMLCRLGTILGMLSVPVFWTLLCTLGLSFRQRVASLVVWCLVPMAWYQGAIPTSEHLQILFLLTAVALYLDAMRSETRLPWLLGCVLFAAVTNRFSFPALCAVMLPVCAFAEALANKKGFRGRWGVCVGGLTLGMIWDFVFNTSTLLRLHEKDNAIVLVAVPFVIGALVALRIASLPVQRWPVLSFVFRKSFLTIGLCLVLCAWAAVSIIKYDAALRVGDYVGISSVLEDIHAHIPDDAIVIVDDARWGTPLALQNGMDVINGHLLWAPAKTPDAQRQKQQRLDVLSEIAEVSGRDLVWLTSTDKQLALYDGLPITNAVKIADLGAFEYRTVIHSRNADHYATEQHTAVFNVFKGGGATVWRQDRAAASAIADLETFAEGREGYVVWESRRPSGTAQSKYRIWKRNLDGSGLEMISGAPEMADYAHQGPRISPDGRWVAFAGRAWNSTVDPDVQTLWGGAYVAPPFDVWVVPMDPVNGAGTPRELTSLRGRAGGGGENRVLEWKDARTLHVTLPENNAIHEVDIHNDRIGRRVVSHLFAEHKGAKSHREAVLSPDGRTLFCAQGQGAWYQRRDSVAEIKAPSIKSAHPLGGCQTFVVPDAPWLIWMGGIGENLRALNLVSGVDHELAIEARLPLGHKYFYFPAASRRGSLLVVGASDFHDHAQADYELFLFNMDTATCLPIGDPVRVTHNRYIDYANRGIYDGGGRRGRALDRWPDVFVADESPQNVSHAAKRMPVRNAFAGKAEWGHAVMQYALALEAFRPIEAMQRYDELVATFGEDSPGDAAQIRLKFHAESGSDVAAEHSAWHQFEALRLRERDSVDFTPQKRAVWREELGVRLQQLAERYPDSRAVLAFPGFLAEAGLGDASKGDAFTHDVKVRVIAISKAPSLKDIAPYDEAFVTIQCEILRVKKGVLTAEDLFLGDRDLDETASGALPAMFGNVMAISGGKHLPAARWSVNDVVRLRAAPWKDFPFFHLHPLSDDIMDLTSPVWYVAPVKSNR